MYGGRGTPKSAKGGKESGWADVCTYKTPCRTRTARCEALAKTITDKIAIDKSWQKSSSMDVNVAANPPKEFEKREDNATTSTVSLYLVP